MREVVVEEPVKIGYPFGLELNWPAGYLQPGESVKAELRRTPANPERLALFASNRAGDTVELTLTGADTADLEPGRAVCELALTTASGSLPVIGPRLVLNILHHTTRAS